MNSKLILSGILVLLTILLIGCDDMPSPDRQKSSAGVTVKGYSANGYIENKNSFPVKVREVWVFSGERTKWIKVFQPGERKNQFVSHQHGFYIMDMNDKLLGYIFVGNY
jgi:hypothetical protein